MFFSVGGWGYVDISLAYKGVLQGWAGSINGVVWADRFRLAFIVRMDGAASPDGFAGAFVCAVDDRFFDDFDRHRPGTCGYYVLICVFGSLELQVVNDGVAH